MDLQTFRAAAGLSPTLATSRWGSRARERFGGRLPRNCGTRFVATWATTNQVTASGSWAGV